MLLQPLVSTIETIKERIATHGTVLRQNETRTRMALIDPLLGALGWDTSDPALATSEYRTGGWADYALIGVRNKPAAIIEAKRLGSVVENHLEQAVGYCIQEGIAYAGVTDGNHWQLYRTFEPVPLVEKLVLDISIADTLAHEAAFKLLLLWRPNLSTGQPVEASAPVLASISDDAPSVPVRMVDNGMPDPVDQASEPVISRPTSVSLSVTTEEGWIPLSKIFPKSGDKPALAIRFADGRESDLRRAWVGLVESTAAWLWSEELLTLENVPVQSSSERYIVNLKPLHPEKPSHPEGNKFKNSRPIDGTPLWTEGNIGCTAAASKAKKLLEHCDVSSETIFLRFE